MKSLVLLGLLVLFSCGSRNSKVEFGSTTKADIISFKGEPLQEEKIPQKDGSIMLYRGETYQLKRDILTHLLRNPLGDEQALIYWKHKFKDCTTKEIQLPHQKDTHTPPEIQLSCDELGLGVTYTAGSELVTRVLEYEKK